MDLNPFDNIGHGLKKLGGQISGLIEKLNPADDIHKWVENRLKIFKLEMGIWFLEQMQNFANKGFDGMQADMQAEIDALKGK